MKKLERKELKCNSSSEEFIRIGYNKAIAEYEAFLPSADVLVKIIMRYNTPYEAGQAIHKWLTEGR